MDASLRGLLACVAAAGAFWFFAIAAGRAHEYWHEWKKADRAMAALRAYLAKGGRQ